MGSIDPRFGVGWPHCDRNTGRRSVRLDFGLGAVFDVEYQSGAIEALLRAVAKVRAINDDPNDGASYKVTVAGTYACRQMRTHAEASWHSWPVAIDINPQNNSMGGGRGDIPNWLAQCFQEEGFEWGLAWNDAMHFQNGTWYGPWDGTYPEVDELTADDKKWLAEQFANVNAKLKEQGATLERQGAFLDGVREAEIGTGTGPAKDALPVEKAGYHIEHAAKKILGVP